MHNLILAKGCNLQIIFTSFILGLERGLFCDVTKLCYKNAYLIGYCPVCPN